MFTAALNRGYDSIQFLNHSDMRCGNTAIEIVDVRGVGKFPCSIQTIDDSWKKRYKTGYNARNDCVCDNTIACFNCKKNI